MKIQQPAVAGTVESSDVQIMLIPNESGIQIDLDSQVIEQFGDQIRTVILDTLSVYQITDVLVKVLDKGALDCVIRARLSAAIHRSLGVSHDIIPWEVAEK